MSRHPGRLPADLVERGDARITRALHALLGELAEPLMRVGITPRQFGELAARAFVHAACKASTLRNGRINQSRVAVLTGLSRPEVRKLMRGSPAPGPRHQPRTMRVIEGWTSDARYATRSGAPRTLPISGATRSFAELVREYAGDVPHHAVLEELCRIKLVKEEHRRVRLVTTVAPLSRSFGRSLGDVLAIVSDGVALSSTHSGSAKGMHRLTLTASDVRDAIAMYERALSSAASFVSGLDQSLQAAPARRASRQGNRVTISVLVRLQESGSKTRRQKDVP